MKQSDLALKSHRVTVRMTGPTFANLRRLAGTDRRIGEEIRNAIRLYWTTRDSSPVIQCVIQRLAMRTTPQTRRSMGDIPGAMMHRLRRDIRAESMSGW
jgi:hypothetical protein